MIVTEPAPRRAPGRAGRWPTVTVAGAYLAAALYLTWSWWTPLGGRVTALNERDAVLFSWLLSATPHAVAEGRFPLFTDLLNAPSGINMMWNNGMVLPGLLFAPITQVWGGVGTVTVITTVGLAGSAATAFSCLTRLGVRVLPAALGGALFGFSPAITAQALGAHPNLVLDLLTPVLVLLSVRLMTDPSVRPRTAVLLGVTAGLQVLVGEEVLFDTGIVVALILLVLVASHPRTALTRAPVFLARAALALGVFLLIAGLPLGFQLVGPLQQRGSPFTTAYYASDLANFVVPTQVQLLASDSDGALSARFAGGLEERAAYLGWPLIVLCALVLILMWRNTRVRTSLLVALAVAVLSLGAELTVAGEPTGVPLPWALVAGLPGFDQVLVNRLALFTAGMIGAGLAFAMDELSVRHRAFRAAGVVAVLAAFVPVVPAPLPGKDTAPIPGFFTGPAATALACPGGSALVLPYPGPPTTEPMRWQEAAGFAFAMPGGYFIGPADNGAAYLGGQPSATGRLFDDVMRDGRTRPVTPQLRAAFARDMRRWNACAVVLGPAVNLGALRDQATALIGREPEVVDGVYLWRRVSGN